MTGVADFGSCHNKMGPLILLGGLDNLAVWRGNILSKSQIVYYSLDGGFSKKNKNKS